MARTNRTASQAHRRWRQRLITQARQQGQTECPLCGVTITWDTHDLPTSPEADHITPVSRGGLNKKDYDWWMHYGPIFVDRWKQWRTNHPQYHTAVLDGQPGIEYPVETTLQDGTKIVGYIDRVFTDTNTGETFILDLKTGRLPVDAMQLHTYRYMLAQNGIQVTKGMFWTPATSRTNTTSPTGGTATELYDLDNNTYRHVSSMYSQAMKGISEGIFVPHVTTMCKGCPVRDACWAVNGKDAYRYPIQTTITPPTEKDEENQ